MARAVHATGGSFIRHRPPRVRGVGGIALAVGVIRADSGGRPLTTKLLTAQITPPAVSRPRPASAAHRWVGSTARQAVRPALCAAHPAALVRRAVTARFKASCRRASAPAKAGPACSSWITLLGFASPLTGGVVVVDHNRDHRRLRRRLPGYQHRPSYCRAADDRRDQSRRSCHSPRVVDHPECGGRRNRESDGNCRPYR
jgi:hypothetical protein